MKVAVVGATGLVGTRMLEVLAERNFPVTELYPVASEKSVGRKITFKGKGSPHVRTLPFSLQEQGRQKNLLRNLPKRAAVWWTTRHAGVWIRPRSLSCRR